MYLRGVVFDLYESCIFLHDSETRRLYRYVPLQTEQLIQELASRSPIQCGPRPPHLSGFPLASWRGSIKLEVFFSVELQKIFHGS